MARDSGFIIKNIKGLRMVCICNAIKKLLLFDFIFIPLTFAQNFTYLLNCYIIDTYAKRW